MADSAQGNGPNFLKSSAEDKGDLLGKIDTGVYKQLLIFLGIAIVLAIGFYIFLRLGQEPPATSNTAATSSQVNTKKLNQIKTESSFNQQRKNDIATINSALESYFSTNEKAPKLLKELISEDLPKLPTDPVTKQEYSYTPAKDFKTWKLAAPLSDGTLFEVEGP
jgi:hypothetical protein